VASISNLFVDQGASYSNIITVASTTGAPLDLTNYTVKSQMRKSYTSSTAYDFTASIYDAANGKVRLQLNTAQSTAIIPGRYLYDVEITNSVGEKTRVIEGIVTVSPEITKT
jgi:hypothetical protein